VCPYGGGIESYGGGIESYGGGIESYGGGIESYGGGRGSREGSDLWWWGYECTGSVRGSMSDVQPLHVGMMGVGVRMGFVARCKQRTIERYGMGSLELVEQYVMGEAARWKKEGVGLVSPYEEVKQYMKPGYFLSFTALPKLGMNPRSSYKTPLALYTYYMGSEYFKTAWENQKFPYQTQQPYVQIMKIRSPPNIVTFGNGRVENDHLIVKALGRYREKARTSQVHANAIALANPDSDP